MAATERKIENRKKMLDRGSKRYSIMLGPEYAAIVSQQAQIWGSNNEVFRQALLALETTTSGTFDPASGKSFIIEKDHRLSVEPVGSDKVKMTFAKGEGD